MGSGSVGDAGELAASGLERFEHNFITGRVESLVNWARMRSCWPATFGLACCAIEICLPVAMGHGAEEDQSQHFSSSQSHCSNHMLLKPIPIVTNKQVTNHYIHTYSLAHYAIYIYSGTSI